MKLKFYAIVSIILLMFGVSSMQDAYGSHFKVINGKLTAPCYNMQFGGEEVGSFKMKISKKGLEDWIESLKIVMKTPSNGEYVVGFMGLGSRPSKLPEALVKVDEYRNDGQVMIVHDKPMPKLDNVLFVAARDPRDLGSQWSTINITGSTYLAPSIKLFQVPTKFQYKNATIVHLLEVGKPEYKIGERIELKSKLINIGNETLTITHGAPLFIVNVYNSKGVPAWLHSGSTLPIAIPVKLEPGVPYYGSKEEIQERYYDIRLCALGKYKIISYAHFDVEEKEVSKLKTGKVFSEPVTIRVVP
ncbi:MAG: hypothetical protein QXU32_04085 [Nitrososphaerales archaeon]